jgi:hypothetical protein
MSDLETLYPLVSEAIRRAELLQDLDAPGASAAFLEVSIFEEQIAVLLPPSVSEGAIARRGAIRAAIMASEFGRARALAERFGSEAEPSSAIATELAGLLKEVKKAEEAARPITTTRFPKASRKYGIANIEGFAKKYFDQLAPFPIT